MTVFTHQLWDALLRVECSVEDFSSHWTQTLKKDLRRRISKVGGCVPSGVKSILFIFFLMTPGVSADSKQEPNAGSWTFSVLQRI